MLYTVEIFSKIGSQAAQSFRRSLLKIKQNFYPTTQPGSIFEQTFHGVSFPKHQPIHIFIHLWGGIEPAECERCVLLSLCEIEMGYIVTVIEHIRGIGIGKHSDG